MTQEHIQQLADQELLARLQRLVHADRALTARLLVHLGEVDARGLYRERAFSSMFEYCVEELHMSESEAYLRIQAARLGRRFPLVVQLLEQGSLHLTAIKLLGPQLTAHNHVELLQRARGKSKRDIELLLATIAPQPDVPSRMRKLPEPSSAPTVPVANEAKPPATSGAASPTPLALETPRTHASSKPLSAPLRCRVAASFNALFAERDYGLELMRSKRPRAREELGPERA